MSKIKYMLWVFMYFIGAMRTSAQTDSLQYAIGYGVDWNMSVYPLSKNTDPNILHRFHMAIKRILESDENKKLHNLNGNPIACSIENPVKEQVDAMRQISYEYDRTPIEGYKWFYGRVIDSDCYVFGFADSHNTFNAYIVRVALDWSDIDDKRIYQISFKLDCDSSTTKTKEWAIFTKANIGNVVIMEINGEYVMAPVVHSEITSGACCISSTSEETLTSLLNLKRP